MRVFAALSPDEVAGTVLVEDEHEDAWKPRFPEEHRKGMRLVTRMMRITAALSHNELAQLARVVKHNTPALLQLRSSL